MAVPQLVIDITPGAYLAAFQGVYSANVTYQPQQIAEYLGGFYIATAVTKAHLPTDTTHWSAL